MDVDGAWVGGRGSLLKRVSELNMSKSTVKENELRMSVCDEVRRGVCMYKCVCEKVSEAEKSRLRGA